MNKISRPTFAYAQKAVPEHSKIGIQIGDVVGHQHPPRVYAYVAEFVDLYAAVGRVHEISSNLPEPQEYADSGNLDEDITAEAADLTEVTIDEAFGSDVDEIPVRVAGADDLVELFCAALTLSGRAHLITEEETEYIPSYDGL